MDDFSQDLSPYLRLEVQGRNIEFFMSYPTVASISSAAKKWAAGETQASEEDLKVYILNKVIEGTVIYHSFKPERSIADEALLKTMENMEKAGASHILDFQTAEKLLSWTEGHLNDFLTRSGQEKIFFKKK